jgi:dipeptidase
MDNKFIPQLNQLISLNNYQNNLNNNLYVINKYNLGITSNLAFSLNPYNTHNNKNHNIHNNPFEIVRQEYLKLKALQKEKPQEIKDNMDLFEYNILLPIYNEVNSNNNNSEIVSKYSKVYSKYREVIESILKKII